MVYRQVLLNAYYVQSCTSRQGGGELTTAASLPLSMNLGEIHNFCCCASYTSTSRALAAAAAAVPPEKWRPWPPQMATPGVRELSQRLLLRRPSQPPPEKDIRLPPSKPPSQGIVVDPPGINAHMDDEVAEEEFSGRGNAASKSCTSSDVLGLMDALQLPVDEDLYLSLIKECTASRDAAQGANVYNHIRRSCPGLLRRPTGLHIANRFLHMFAACGQTVFARQLFDQMPLRDATSWAIIIAGLSAIGSHGDILQLFVEMRVRTDGGSPVLKPVVCWVNSLVTVLRSCTAAKELGLGRQLHGMAIKALGGTNAVVFEDLGDSLIHFYSKLGRHESAVELFERTRSRSAAAWTSMITSFCREGQFKKAICLFREMGRAGGRRNCYVFSSTLAACAKVGDDGWSGKQVHAGAIKLGASSDKFVCSSLVDMYMKHKLLIDGQRAFESMDGVRDYVCWNALLFGYAQRGCAEEAVKLLYQMKAAGIEAQESTVLGVMMGVGGTAAAREQL